ncbi:MAG: cyclase family protein [Candidatus Levyibacteriota bacterium]
MKFIDLTHTFIDAMPVFPGDPPASLIQTAFIEKDGNNDHTLTTAMHAGTHMDAPLHMITDGKRIDELSLEQFFGNGVLIDARGKKEINTDLLEGLIIEEGSVVLLFTDFGKKYHTTEYFSDYPEITEEFVKRLIDLKVKMIGMDTSSPEHNPPWKIHKALLKNHILILENLTNLDQLLTIDDFEVIALPTKLRAAAAPIRVIAKICSPNDT